MIWIYMARIARRLSVGLLMLAAVSGAWAGGSHGGGGEGGGCSGGGQSFTLALPGTVSVARDLPAGALLTNWANSPVSPSLWSCSGGSGNGGVRAQVSPGFNTPSGQTYTSGGVTYTVWNTNVDGVGIVVAWQWIYDPSVSCVYAGGWGGWVNITNSWYGQACVGNPIKGQAGSQMAMALVKTGTVATGGTISGLVAQSAPVDGNTLPALAVSYNITPVRIVPMTCTTPDVNVPMGTFMVADFPSVGSLSPRPASFNVEFLNCPAGAIVAGTKSGMISTVQYRIDPTSGTAATNVAALSGTTKAGGVGIHLFNSAGAVVPLSNMQNLSQFNGSSGGNYNVPMTARYYRTGTVTPGPANATMTLTVLYQ